MKLKFLQMQIANGKSKRSNFDVVGNNIKSLNHNEYKDAKVVNNPTSTILPSLDKETLSS